MSDLIDVGELERFAAGLRVQRDKSAARACREVMGKPFRRRPCGAWKRAVRLERQATEVDALIVRAGEINEKAEGMSEDDRVALKLALADELGVIL